MSIKFINKNPSWEGKELKRGKLLRSHMFLSANFTLSGGGKRYMWRTCICHKQKE